MNEFTLINRNEKNNICKYYVGIQRMPNNNNTIPDCHWHFFFLLEFDFSFTIQQFIFYFNMKANFSQCFGLLDTNTKLFIHINLCLWCGGS